MASVFLRSFEAHSHSYVTRMIAENAPSGRVRSSRTSTVQIPGLVLKFTRDVRVLRLTGE